MNPLSALPTMSYPALRAESLAQPLSESTALKTIPFSELEKLSPGLLPNPIDAGRPASGGFESIITGLVNEVSSKQAAAGQAVNGVL
jgi:hypothetical protein